MSRPSTEAQYLAGLLPPSVAATGYGRRAILKGLLSGAVAVGGAGLLAGCGGGDTAASSGGSAAGAPASGTVTFGSNQSDAVPKAATKAVTDAFTAASKVTVQTNTIDHNTFQQNINNYLQGQPDDVFCWFAGNRMKFFADQGLAGDISDVWGQVSGLSDAFKQQSTGQDGKQYFMPLDNYPWAVFYRPSVFTQRGYAPPATLDELVALATKMQADGLVPLAFADKDGWPAMGTFDQLNLRINGYDFHAGLMAGNESWQDPKVKTVFENWQRLLPFHQPDSLGRTWQEAAQTLQLNKAGMMVFGTQIGQQFTDGPDKDDLTFFPFPGVDPAIGTDAVEAPIDGFMMAPRPKNEAAAKAFLAFLGGPQAGTTFVKSNTSLVATNADADTSGYNALQKKSIEYIKSAKSVSQFMDRDTRPDFASTVMIPALQQFIKTPNDIDGLLKSIEDQKKSIFTN